MCNLIKYKQFVPVYLLDLFLEAMRQILWGACVNQYSPLAAV